MMNDISLFVFFCIWETVAIIQLIGQNGMHCRPPRKIKRYMTDPEECGPDYRSKYGHMNLQELKLQVSAIDTLQEINLPPRQLHPPQPKTPTAFMPLHPKFHLRRNPLKRLPELNAINPNNSNNGQPVTKPVKGPPIFKRSNPLFVVNSLFDILKEETTSDTHMNHKALKPPKDKKTPQFNEFNDFDNKSTKVQRGPRIMESELSRLTQQSIFGRRKIYSEQKSRRGQEVELLTFYKPKEEKLKPQKESQQNQFLS